MQKTKIGLVLFNNAFEDGALPYPPLSTTNSHPSIYPNPPLLPPLSKTGKVLFFSLLHGRGEKMRLHLASFIKVKKVKKVKKPHAGTARVKTENQTERNGNKSLQKRILECKNPEEIETLLIHEGVLKVDF